MPRHKQKRVGVVTPEELHILIEKMTTTEALQTVITTMKDMFKMNNRKITSEVAGELIEALCRGLTSALDTKNPDVIKAIYVDMIHMVDMSGLNSKDVGEKTRRRVGKMSCKLDVAAGRSPSYLDRSQMTHLAKVVMLLNDVERARARGEQVVVGTITETSPNDAAREAKFGEALREHKRVRVDADREAQAIIRKENSDVVTVRMQIRVLINSSFLYLNEGEKIQCVRDLLDAVLERVKHEWDHNEKTPNHKASGKDEGGWSRLGNALCVAMAEFSGLSAEWEDPKACAGRRGADNYVSIVASEIAMRATDPDMASVSDELVGLAMAVIDSIQELGDDHQYVHRPSLWPAATAWRLRDMTNRDERGRVSGKYHALAPILEKCDGLKGAALKVSSEGNPLHMHQAQMIGYRYWESKGLANTHAAQETLRQEINEGIKAQGDKDSVVERSVGRLLTGFEVGTGGILTNWQENWGSFLCDEFNRLSHSSHTAESVSLQGVARQRRRDSYVSQAVRQIACWAAKPGNKHFTTDAILLIEVMLGNCTVPDDNLVIIKSITLVLDRFVNAGEWEEDSKQLLLDSLKKHINLHQECKRGGDTLAKEVHNAQREYEKTLSLAFKEGVLKKEDIEGHENAKRSVEDSPGGLSEPFSDSAKTITEFNEKSPSLNDVIDFFSNETEAARQKEIRQLTEGAAKGKTTLRTLEETLRSAVGRSSRELLRNDGFCEAMAVITRVDNNKDKPLFGSVVKGLNDRAREGGKTSWEVRQHLLRVFLESEVLQRLYGKEISTVCPAALEQLRPEDKEKYSVPFESPPSQAGATAAESSGTGSVAEAERSAPYPFKTLEHKIFGLGWVEGSLIGRAESHAEDLDDRLREMDCLVQSKLNNVQHTLQKIKAGNASIISMMSKVQRLEQMLQEIARERAAEIDALEIWSRNLKNPGAQRDQSVRDGEGRALAGKKPTKERLKVVEAPPVSEGEKDSIADIIAKYESIKDCKRPHKLWLDQCSNSKMKDVGEVEKEVRKSMLTLEGIDAVLIEKTAAFDSALATSTEKLQVLTDRATHLTSQVERCEKVKSNISKVARAERELAEAEALLDRRKSKSIAYVPMFCLGPCGGAVIDPAFYALYSATTTPAVREKMMQTTMPVLWLIRRQAQETKKSIEKDLAVAGIEPSALKWKSVGTTLLLTQLLSHPKSDPAKVGSIMDKADRDWRVLLPQKQMEDLKLKVRDNDIDAILEPREVDPTSSQSQVVLMKRPGIDVVFAVEGRPFDQLDTTSDMVVDAATPLENGGYIDFQRKLEWDKDAHTQQPKPPRGQLATMVKVCEHLILLLAIGLIDPDKSEGKIRDHQNQLDKIAKAYAVEEGPAQIPKHDKCEFLVFDRVVEKNALESIVEVVPYDARLKKALAIKNVLTTMLNATNEKRTIDSDEIGGLHDYYLEVCGGDAGISAAKLRVMLELVGKPNFRNSQDVVERSPRRTRARSASPPPLRLWSTGTPPAEGGGLRQSTPVTSR